MTRIRRISVWLLVLVVANALAQTFSPKDTEVSTDEDYAIFAAALKQEFGGQKSDKVLLRDHTSIRFMAGDDQGQMVLQDIPDVPKDAKDDFDSRNKRQAKIETRKIKAPFEVVALNAEEEEKLVQDGGACEAKAPIAFVSRPGLNAEHNRALLYVSTSCYDRESGLLIFLRKDAPDWRVLSKSGELNINIDPEPPRSARPSTLVTPKIVSVQQTDSGNQYLFDVSFVIPDAPNFTFDTITVYGMRIIRTQRSDDKSYPSLHGHWRPNDQVEFSVRVPKEFTDPSTGWILTFCVGSTASCYPSPNLLTLITEKGK